jgi:hypothetical protein
LAAGAGLVTTGQFNVGGSEGDYRVPDLGLHRDFTDRVWYPTAALVAEIVSPGDEIERSSVLESGPAELAHQIDWP